MNRYRLLDFALAYWAPYVYGQPELLLSTKILIVLDMGYLLSDYDNSFTQVFVAEVGSTFLFVTHCENDSGYSPH